jgi:ubiquinone/menaquinone biosynthesis C-methylase UbiE
VYSCLGDGILSSERSPFLSFLSSRWAETRFPTENELGNEYERYLFKNDVKGFLPSFGVAAYIYKNRFYKIIETVTRILPKNSKILDVGTADGNFALRLANEGYEVVALDIRSQFINYAKKKISTENEKENLTFLVQDIFNSSFKPNCFDCILALEIIEHTHFPEKLIETLLRILKINGILVVSTVNRERISNLFSKKPPSYLSFRKEKKREFGKEGSFSGKDHIYEFNFGEMALFFRRFRYVKLLKHEVYTYVPLLPFSFFVPVSGLIRFEEKIKSLLGTSCPKLFFGQFAVIRKVSS